MVVGFLEHMPAWRSIPRNENMKVLRELQVRIARQKPPSTAQSACYELAVLTNGCDMLAGKTYIMPLGLRSTSSCLGISTLTRICPYAMA